MCQTVLLLSCHEQPLLILLLKQHKLHLIVLQSMVAAVAVRLACGGGNLSTVRALQRDTTVVGCGVEFSSSAVHARLAHGTTLRSAGAHVGRDALVHVRICIVHIVQLFFHG